MRKVFIDVSVLTLATFVTGIQRVTREIAVRLIQDSTIEIVLLHYNAAENVYYRINNDAFVDFYVHHTGVKEKMISKQQIPLNAIGEGSIFFDLDAAWMCRLKRSYLLPILKAQGAKVIAHIYDIISITHPQYCLERGVYNFMDFIGAHLQYADEIIVNAKATVDELEKLTDRLGMKLPSCHVVPLGADFRQKKEIAASDMDTKLVEAVNGGPFILMVGTVEPRKNHKLLLEAYDKGLKELGYHIIFAGYMGWNMEEFARNLHAHPDYAAGVYHFEGLNDDAISYLYQHAKFLAFCSYTEGFGLPIIEAIQRGTPVIAANVPVLKEVGGDYCVWFEQDNAGDLLNKIKEYTADEVGYKHMRDKISDYQVTSWEETVRQVRSYL